MAGYSHIPACCLSKLGSSLGAGKKQLRVWLEYVCSVAMMFSFLTKDAIFNKLEELFARELATALGYSTWQKFKRVLNKALQVAQQRGYGNG